MKKYYIGIDPDLRVLNAAVVSEDMKSIAVFVRRNRLSPTNKDDVAVANAFRMACRLVDDVIAYVVAECPDSQFTTIVESQSMMHTKRMRESGRKINYQSILQTGQVAGALGGAFSNLSTEMFFVPPMEWKKGVPKKIHHKRIYTTLRINPPAVAMVANMYPSALASYTQWSEDKINPGDFNDINDSLGLALYGIRKGKI